MTAERTSPRVGVIGIRDGWSSQRLTAAVAKHTGEDALIDLAHVALDLNTGRVTCGRFSLNDFDALVIKKLGERYSPELLDRLEILYHLSQRGVRIFSDPAALMRLLDRLSCTITLRLGDIPMPTTVITEDVDEAVAAIQRLERVVLKPLYTSKARGMEVVEAGDDAREQVAAFKADGNPVMYIQQLVDLPGRDLGVVFLGGEYLACYSRVAHDQSWHTSSSKGGKYQPHEPSPEVVALAQRAQALFGLDFTCVDVAETAAGPLVFEVSAFGGFRGLLKANGIDAAERYAAYVFEELRHGD